MVEKFELINILLGEVGGGGRYLEIGVQTGITYAYVEAKVKVGVDPMPMLGYNMVFLLNIWGRRNEREWYLVPDTSDVFFKDGFKVAEIPKEYEVIFVDGLHEYRQVLRDIRNSMEHLVDGGYILIHDTAPDSAKKASGKAEEGDWNGTVYQAIYDLHISGAKYYTVEGMPEGMTILPKQELRLPTASETPGISYEEFDKNRAEILHLKPFADILREIKGNKAEGTQSG